MSYDLYFYRSKIGNPDEAEADSVIEADKNKWAKKEKNPAMKLAIVKALMACNPRLEAFDFHYGEIAKLTEATIEEARDKFDHIEINHPEEDLALQINVYDNHVFLTIPYWYQGPKAEQLFEYIKAYIKIIRETAGYFISDPQTGQVFDPVETEFDGLGKYLSVQV
jgi:hypothetical protein